MQCHDEEQVNELVQFAHSNYGSVDVLINNAGLGQNPVASEDATEEEIDRIIGVNLKGVYFGCQAAIPYMKQQGSGVIINTASMSAVRPRQGNVMYMATKGAVITLTKALAIELAPKESELLASIQSLLIRMF